MINNQLDIVLTKIKNRKAASFEKILPEVLEDKEFRQPPALILQLLI